MYVQVPEARVEAARRRRAVAGAALVAVVDELTEAMAAMESIARGLPEGFGYEWTGQSFEERLSGAQAPALFALSILVD